MDDRHATQKNLDRMAKVIEMMPFMKHLGMEFVGGARRLREARACTTRTRTSTAAKALHGGAISSLIDTTGAMAAWTTAEIATPKYFGSTVGINVNYLSGAIGEDIFAEGTHPQARQGDHLLRRPRHERRRQAARAGHRRLPHRRKGGLTCPSFRTIEEPQTEELKDLYARLEQGGLGLGVLNIFKVMAHSPDLMRRLAPHGHAAPRARRPHARPAPARDRDPPRRPERPQRVRVRAPRPHRQDGRHDGRRDPRPPELRRRRPLLRARPRRHPLHRRRQRQLTEDAPDIARELKRWLSDRSCSSSASASATGAWSPACSCPSKSRSTPPSKPSSPQNGASGCDPGRLHRRQAALNHRALTLPLMVRHSTVSGNDARCVRRRFARHAPSGLEARRSAHDAADIETHSARVITFCAASIRIAARRSGGTADALRSGRSVLTGVGVQIPPSAPT